MPDRQAVISQFLEGTHWAGFAQNVLAGDASARSYLRLSDPETGKSVVLMDAPPDKNENFQSFSQIAHFLNSNGFSAPKIFKSDALNGLMILEDFGDDVFSHIIAKDPRLERPLYETAVDSLAGLHLIPPPASLNPADPEEMSKLTGVAFDWYVRGATNDSKTVEKDATEKALTSALSKVLSSRQVVALRDFHSENLIWLPDRAGIRKVGLLDFQDAFLCHPAYDLVSLLTDARRDVALELKEKMIARYVKATNTNEDDFNFAFSTLSVQRNLRIIGVFARLSMHYGKPAYLEFLPRVWSYLLNDLKHPKLESLSKLLLSNLPGPSADVIEVLKKKCATAPTP